MKLIVQKTNKISDGTHTGVIVGVEYREKPYEYTDLVIEFENSLRIKAGFPTSVTPDSKLGKIMQAFGQGLSVGDEVEPEKIFIGQKCSFMTMTETTERGSFAKVVPGSLKHIPAPQ